MRIGIIGGTGLYAFAGEQIKVHTTFGSVDMHYHQCNNDEVFFISRHGSDHLVPPHCVNHRANIHALYASKVERIMAVNTVGSMDMSVLPGSLFVPHDFIDFSGNPATFYDDRTVHVDMSKPFCPVVRAALIDAVGRQGVYYEGVYASTVGPRFETKSEIAMMKQFADVVGMTLAAEATLARERGLCFGSLCVVSNMAAGLQDVLPAGEIATTYTEIKQVVTEVIEDVIGALSGDNCCECHKAIDIGQL